MRFSLTLGAAGPGRDPRSLGELAKLAEDSGWDAMFLEDYIVYQGDPDVPTYDPWVCLAAMAMTTSTIRLGTTVTPVPRRRPWKLAAEAMSIDHLSDGRLILGVGLGDTGDPSMSAVGEPTDPKTLAELTDEALTIIDRLWTGEPVTFEGKHYRVDGMRLNPRPVQRPRIPIWVGGDLRLPGVRRRLARWDGCFAYKSGPEPIHADDIREIRALVEQEQGTAEHYDFRVGGGPHPAYEPGQAEAGATWFGRWIPVVGPVETNDIVRAGPPSLP
jgi:alkanesulfonate monooxygenase SsuD/methylene tetrahydromethanopterin reductase-like flavin-dependent oxidoreductase (luciferase family)